MSHNDPTPEPGAGSIAPCRLMLAAIDAALRLPPPAGKDDEHARYVLLGKRAALVLETCGYILRNRTADSLDILSAADVLHVQIERVPADTYQHSALAL